MIWTLAVCLAFAGSPDDLVTKLEIPHGVTVEVNIVGERWQFVVTSAGTRVFDTRPPETEAEQEVIVAMLESLFVDLALPSPPTPADAASIPSTPPLRRPAPEAPTPPSGDLVLMPPPARFIPVDAVHPLAPAPQVHLPSAPPIEPAEPVLEQPSASQGPLIGMDTTAAQIRSDRTGKGSSFRAQERKDPPREPVVDTRLVALDAPRREQRSVHLVPWLGVDGAVRPGTSLGLGLSVGAALPAAHSLQIAASASLSPPRALAAARDATFAEITTALDVSGTLSWFRLRGGLGIVARDYRQYGDLVHRSVTPRAHADVELLVSVQRSTLGFGGGVDADLARVYLTDGEDTVLLFPLSVRSGIRFEFGGKSRTRSKDPDIGDAGEQSAPP